MWRGFQFKDICWYCYGCNRWLITLYIRHNLFHQSELGWDVELQKMHIVVSKCPRALMQVTTLSAPLWLGFELVDWYREASAPYGNMLIHLCPRTDGRSRFCTITGSSLSKLYILEQLKQLKILDNEHRNYLYPSSFPLIFPQMHKFFSFSSAQWNIETCFPANAY